MALLFWLRHNAVKQETPIKFCHHHPLTHTLNHNLKFKSEDCSSSGLSSSISSGSGYIPHIY